MLSYHDLGKEIGKNIYIYPLKANNVKGNTIDFTASRFAFSSEGASLYKESQKAIVIPRNTTACVITTEALYLSGKIGGTCHSRVGLIQKGIGHIGTTLDPFYCGQLLVVLHNTTDKEIVISENERIISLMFYYLESPILEDTHTWAPTHLDKILEPTKSLYINWLSENSWANNKDLLINNCIDSEELKKFKKSYKTKIKRSGTFWERFLVFLKHNQKAFVSILAVLILYAILEIFLFSKMNDADSGRLDYIIAAGTFMLGLFIGKSE